MRLAVSRASGTERVVAPLELFFDLVYVFAIGELSHHLLGHVDLRTGAETVVLAAGRLLRLVHDGLGRELARARPAAGAAAARRADVREPAHVGRDRRRVRRPRMAVRHRLPGPAGRARDVPDRGACAGGSWAATSSTTSSGSCWPASSGSPAPSPDGDARLVLWALAVVVTYVGGWALHWLPSRGRFIDLDHTEISGEHLCRALPAVLHHRARRDGAGDRHRVHRRAVRARAPARAGHRVRGSGRAVVVLLRARRGDRRRGGRARRRRRRARLAGHAGR